MVKRLDMSRIVVVLLTLSWVSGLQAQGMFGGNGDPLKHSNVFFERNYYQNRCDYLRDVNACEKANPHPVKLIHKKKTNQTYHHSSDPLSYNDVKKRFKRDIIDWFCNLLAGGNRTACDTRHDPLAAARPVNIVDNLATFFGGKVPTGNLNPYRVSYDIAAFYRGRKASRDNALAGFSSRSKIELDIGGEGRVTNEAGIQTNGFITAVNVNIYNRKTNLSQHNEEIENLLVADATKLPFSTNFADAIYAENAFLNTKVLSEMARVIRAPGLIYLNSELVEDDDLKKSCLVLKGLLGHHRVTQNLKLSTYPSFNKLGTNCLFMVYNLGDLR